MAKELRELDVAQQRGLNSAAALAKSQLEYAREIVNEVMQGNGNDSVLVGAVVQAIATNYAATQKG